MGPSDFVMPKIVIYKSEKLDVGAWCTFEASNLKAHKHIVASYIATYTGMSYVGYKVS